MFQPQDVLDVLEELEDKVATSLAKHDATEVVILTDFANKHGASKAERLWTSMHKDFKDYPLIAHRGFFKKRMHVLPGIAHKIIHKTHEIYT